MNESGAAFLLGVAFGYLMAAFIVWLFSKEENPANRFGLVLLLMVMSLMVASVARSQNLYTLEDMELVCSQEFSPQQVIDCTSAQRRVLGLWSMEQVDHLIDLHGWYRDAEIWEEASDVTEQIKEVIRHNEWQRVGDLVTLLLWDSDRQDCFERKTEEGSEWMYEKWVEGCADLRFYVTDCYIMAARIAEIVGDWRAMKVLSEKVASLSLGITGEPLTVLEVETFTYRDNMNVPVKYNSRLWMIRADRAAKRLEEG